MRLGDTGTQHGGPSGGVSLQFGTVEDAGLATQPWIVTGMSGAGKATALRALEAAGVAGVDNLPVPLIDAFTSAHRTHPAVAVVDARRGDELAGLQAIAGARVVFLDAPDAVLVRRLADSSRPHPCASAGAGQAAVSAERSLLVPLRAAADVVIDTGAMTEADLAERIVEVVAPGPGGAAVFRCTVSSFGFKYGPEAEADWVIDSRVLPNPFWEPELRPLTGLDAPVRDFVMRHSESQELVERCVALLGWVIDAAQRRGRTAMHIAVGCTGGRHRSVVVAAELAARLGGGDVAVDVRHRDVRRPDPR